MPRGPMWTWALGAKEMERRRVWRWFVDGVIAVRTGMLSESVVIQIDEIARMIGSMKTFMETQIQWLYKDAFAG